MSCANANCAGVLPDPLDQSVARPAPCIPPPGRVAAELDACAAETERLGKSYYGGGHGAQIADVLDAICGGGEPFVTARAAAETVDLVLGIYAAHRSGRRVALAPRLPARAATA